MFSLFLVLGCAGDPYSSVLPQRSPGDPHAPDTGAQSEPDTGESTPGEPDGTIYEDCFADFMGTEYPLPDYDAAGARIASHCQGTDHQDIPQDIERVVFIGDSVTMGSPPTDSKDWYRNRLMVTLADRYGLQEAGWEWQNVDIFSGKPYERFDGDFGVCAWWGARTDDLLLSNQLPDCLPEEERHKKTLVFITSGGNDVFKQVQAKGEGATDSTIDAAYVEWVRLMREALEWLKEPGRFPNGVYVVFSNVYEYSDGTGDLGSCPGADMFGFGGIDTTHIDELTRQAMGDYLQMAADTQFDMLLMREAFCGHGYNAGQTNVPCYRGGGAEVWFDTTCIHPNGDGHAAIAQMMLSVLDE